MFCSHCVNRPLLEQCGQTSRKDGREAFQGNAYKCLHFQLHQPIGSPKGKYETLQLLLLYWNPSLCPGQQEQLEGMDQFGRFFKRETKIEQPRERRDQLNQKQTGNPFPQGQATWECIFLPNSRSKCRVYQCFCPREARAQKRECIFKKWLSSPRFMLLKLEQTCSWEPRQRARGILYTRTTTTKGGWRVIPKKIHLLSIHCNVTHNNNSHIKPMRQDFFCFVFSCFSTDEESESQSSVNNLSKDTQQ